MIDTQLWNDILDRSLEGRAVDMVLAAEVPLDFKEGGVPRLLDGLSWRGESQSVVAMEVLYLLSMIAFTGEEFKYSVSSRPKPINFLGVYRTGFVVAAAGPSLRDNGRGLRTAVGKALAELSAATRG